jgi:hypothetical protein
MAEISELSNINRQHKELFDEFEKWKPLFKDVRDFVYPYLGYFEGEEYNKGTRPDDEMLRTMNIEYANILAAGMQWGITSPTRPWVEYSLDNNDLMQDPDVLEWLAARRKIVLDVFARSNFYPSNHQFYLELGVFNTAAMLIEDDDDTVINCRTFTCGEFAIGLDKKGMPNSFARNIQMTTYQIIEQFGTDNVPAAVERDYENKNFHNIHDVKHLICPNKNHDPSKIDTLSMKFTDYYWMEGQKEGEYLRKSGFNEFPVMIERWQTKGNNIYGYGPGIWSLGDAKQTQLMWRNMDTAVELMTKPPVQAPSDIMKNGGINMLPAAINYYNAMGGSDGSIKPLFNVNMNLEASLTMSQAVEDCVKKHFKTEVFQLISEINQGKGTRTAREVIELTAEKMSQMGPLLDRLQTGYFQQLFNRVDSICVRKNIFPPPPPVLLQYGGMNIQVKYVSVLSQAQQQYQITPIIDSVTNIISIANTAQLPEVLDNVDLDDVARNLMTLNGAPATMQVSKQKVAELRQARAQQQAQMNAAQMGMSAAQGAKTLSQADTSGDNALTQLLGGPVGGLTQ